LSSHFCVTSDAKKPVIQTIFLPHLYSLFNQTVLSFSHE
jgi:hypothetical protein